MELGLCLDGPAWPLDVTISSSSFLLEVQNSDNVCSAWIQEHSVHLAAPLLIAMCNAAVHILVNPLQYMMWVPVNTYGSSDSVGLACACHNLADVLTGQG
jgi:hypothetical protein